VSKNILYIGNKLAGKGRTVTTIDALGPLLQQEGFHLRYASSIQNVSARLLHMMRAIFLNRKWANYVLIDTYSTRNFWYAIIIGRLCKLLHINYIPILHGGNLPERLVKNPNALKTFIENAYRVVSPSDYLIDAFAKAGFQQLINIPNHIDLNQYSFKPRTVLRPKILWVRSFAEIYNPEMALEILEHLAVDYPDAKLCMIGPDKDGAMKSCVSIAVQKHLNVEFTGLLDKTDWIEMSQEYDVFINTSHFDNLPVSLIEVMALGLPVISTNVGGIPYLIDHGVNGFLVKPNQALEAAQWIRSLVGQDVDVKSVVQNARGDAEKFAWHKVKQSWLQLLKG